MADEPLETRVEVREAPRTWIDRLEHYIKPTVKAIQVGATALIVISLIVVLIYNAFAPSHKDVPEETVKRLYQQVAFQAIQDSRHVTASAN